MNPEEDDWEGEGGLTIDPESDIIRDIRQGQQCPHIKENNEKKSNEKSTIFKF